MTELVADQKQLSVAQKFYWFWILAGAIGWPVCWALVILGHSSIGIAAFGLGLLFQIIEPKKPAQPTDWFKLSLIGLYLGFEFSWNTGNSNPIDFMALAALGSLVLTACEVVVIAIMLGPVWLLLTFASLICAVERAKWRGLLFPTSAKSLVAKWFLNTGVLMVVVVVSGVSGSIDHRLGELFGWPMTGTEFNLVIRFVLGLIGGVIISRVGQRLINLISQRIHRSALPAR